jgi:hypothetical protein
MAAIGRERHDHGVKMGVSSFYAGAAHHVLLPELVLQKCNIGLGPFAAVPVGLPSSWRFSLGLAVSNSPSPAH